MKEEIETTFEYYLRYAAELYNKKEFYLLDEMKELNNKPTDAFRNQDLVNIEETVWNTKFKKVRVFDETLADAAKALLGVEEKVLDEKEKEKENEKAKEKEKTANVSYISNIIKITNSPPRNAKRLTVYSNDSPYVKPSSALLRSSIFTDEQPNVIQTHLMSPTGEEIKKKKSRVYNARASKLDKFRDEPIPQIPRKFVIIKYVLITTLYSGQFFGETALETRDNIRNATCVCVNTENTHLGEVNIDTYKDFVFTERSKVRLREVSFLLDNFFFKGIKKNYFEKKYYTMIIQETYIFNKILFKENDAADFIYFIREGQVELSFNYSMIELHRRVRSLLGFIPEYKGMDYPLQNGKLIFLS